MAGVQVSLYINAITKISKYKLQESAGSEAVGGHIHRDP